MAEKMRLFLEVRDGLLVPLAVDDVHKVLEGIGVIVPGNTNKVITDYITHCEDHLLLSTKDVAKYIKANFNKKLSTIDIANNFCIDIGVGKSKKTPEQIRAYHNIYDKFKTARKLIAKSSRGEWVYTKGRFDDPAVYWTFKINEAESQKTP
jgi:hypothetical protein